MESKFLMLILLLSGLNVILTTIFMHLKINYVLNNSLYVIIHHFLWIALLSKIAPSKKYIFVPYLFLIFGIGNLIFGEGNAAFNYDTFVFGSFLYVLILFYESFTNLKNENLAFFFQNQYLLITAPLLFFISFSLVFAFGNKSLSDTLLFSDVSLFNFISIFCNTIYYSMINYYIYREKKTVHAL